MDNKIPEGATHVIADVYSLSENQKRMNDKHPYRMIKNGIWHAFVHDGWWPVNYPEPGRYQRIEKQWSGPQDGLPPEGTVCEVKGAMSHYLKWNKVTVFAVRGNTVLFDMEDGRWGQTDSHEFRAIRTPEQIANDLRESKIVKFMNTVGIDCRVTATKAVDAGYVREVE